MTSYANQIYYYLLIQKTSWDLMNEIELYIVDS